MAAPYSLRSQAVGAEQKTAGTYVPCILQCSFQTFGTCSALCVYIYIHIHIVYAVYIYIYIVYQNIHIHTPSYDIFFNIKIGITHFSREEMQETKATCHEDCGQKVPANIDSLSIIY